jgi:hypothetical protein
MVRVWKGKGKGNGVRGKVREWEGGVEQGKGYG